MYALAQLAPRNAAPAAGRKRPRPNPKIVIAAHPDAVTRWVKLKDLYAKMRGAVLSAKDSKRIPNTTNSDVLQLATLWSREVAKLSKKGSGFKSEMARWRACMDTVKTNADPAKPDALYPLNEEFWSECTARLAVYLKSRRAIPSKWSLVKESVKESASDVLDVIASVPGAVGSATKAAAGAAAGLLGAPAKAALVLLGAVILLPPVIRAVRK